MKFAFYAFCLTTDSSSFLALPLPFGVYSALFQMGEPHRVSGRLQLLRGWSHDEAYRTLFP